jgi:acid phosphatase type 7
VVLTTAVVVLGLVTAVALVLTHLMGRGASRQPTMTWPLTGRNQVDEVHLSWSGDPRTSVAIAWRSTPWSGNGAAVRINQRWQQLPAHAALPRPRRSEAYEVVQVTGLRPGTTYPYLIRSRVGTTSEGSFTTAPEQPAPFRFDVFADQGDCSHSPAACRVIDGIAADRPAFVLGAGDLSYANHNGPGAWDQWFDEVQAFARAAPLMPTVGNHEFPKGDPSSAFPDPISSYKGRFVLPPAHHEDYYSFDYAGVHVVALPEVYVPMGPRSAFRRWLTADLSAANNNPRVRWKVAFDHRPFHSSGRRHGAYEHFVQDELPTLEQQHVDLVFSGHEHNYERTLPLRGGAPVSRDVHHAIRGAGTTYVVTGGGGASTYDDFGPMPSWDAARRAHHEHVRVDVRPTELHLVSTTDYGKVIDDLTITAR